MERPWTFQELLMPSHTGALNWKLAAYNTMICVYIYIYTYEYYTCILHTVYVICIAI